MQTYEITHIVDNEEWENKLKELAQRFHKLNNWTEKDLLQFAVINMPMYKVWLMFLEDTLIKLEQTQKRKRLWNKLFHKDK